MKFEVFAIDFDGTIASEKLFPIVGSPIQYAKESLNFIKKLGGTIILWTCRCDQALESALEYLDKNNIKYDYVNENSVVMKDYYGNDPRKVGADIYIDDKAILGEVNWLDIMAYILDEYEYAEFIKTLS